jgi:hypothetical protein
VNQEKGYDFGHHVIRSLMGPPTIRAYDFRDKAKDLPSYWRDMGTSIATTKRAWISSGPKRRGIRTRMMTGRRSQRITNARRTPVLLMATLHRACVCSRSWRACALIAASFVPFSHLEFVSKTAAGLSVRCLCRVYVSERTLEFAVPSLKKASTFPLVLKSASILKTTANTIS